MKLLFFYLYQQQKLIICFALLSLQAFANHYELKSSAYLPYTRLSIEHLNKENYQLKSIDQINAALSSVSLDNRTTIIENSIKEKILNNDILPQKRLHISSSFIKKLELKLLKDKDIYTKFSLKVISDILNDYKAFLKTGFLNRYQSYSRTNPKEVTMYKNLKSTIKLSSNILHQFLNNSAEIFQKKLSKIIEQAFVLSLEKAHFYQFFTQQKVQDQDFLSIKKKRTTKKLMKKEDKLQDAIKDIDSNIMDGASEEIDKIKI